MNVSIFYFSGTGNSENVAKWMAAEAKTFNLECNIYNIATINRKAIEPLSEESMIIMISPVHGFNFPPVMLNFIARFPKGKNRVVLMDTRAGMLIKNFNLPGISGAAFLLSGTLLKLKGYTITGIQSVDLPSNWMSLHPGLNSRTIQILHEKQKVRVMAFANHIFRGEKKYIPVYEFIVDGMISPLAIAYYFVGRFMFAKTFYTSRDCNNCDVCIQNCPVHAIIKVDHRPFWTFRCESCMRCMSNCPKKSIQTAHGFIIAYGLFSSLLTALFYYYFNHLFFVITNNLIRFIIETSIFLLFLALFQRIIHYLMRFKFIESFMVFTSLTRYKFWGKRYKALKNF